MLLGHKYEQYIKYLNSNVSYKTCSYTHMLQEDSFEHLKVSITLNLAI